MADYGFPTRPSLFSRTLREIRELYLSSGRLVVREHPEFIEDQSGDYVALMDDLHRALVLKIYVTVCEADREWSKDECFLAEVLYHHLWNRWLDGDSLREAMKESSKKAAGLNWQQLVRLFERVEPLRDRIGQLETLVTRLANLVARCDGSLNPQEEQVLRMIKDEMQQHLRHGPKVDHIEPVTDTQPAVAVQQEQRADPRFRREPPARKTKQSRSTTKSEAAEPETPKLTVEEALAELERLIGLQAIKQEVRSLANFIKLQQKREAAGLPETDISLHMVFAGNPGTGKTTVARIVGKIFGALGVLEKGHLIETDRSGLVAEYAGQTGPKTNKKVDEAMEGLLFIDEAYSLVATQSDDPYGREAIQALLKRAEDDREHLVVILAGYPDEMQDLLQSNPGLTSRFNRQLTFVDYTPLELCQIFGLMCKKNHYELAPDARLRVMRGLEWLHARRDRHFGNGRTSRNLFEHAVRRLANRLASESTMTMEQLTRLEGSDIEFKKIPSEVFDGLDNKALRIDLACPECEHAKATPREILGKKVKCPKCQKLFKAEWGAILPLTAANVEKAANKEQAELSSE